MAIPSSNHPAWAKVVTGDIEVPSSKLAVNMLVHNCRVKYRHNPSPENLTALVNYVHAVFNKYGTVYSDELQRIFG